MTKFFSSALSPLFVLLVASLFLLPISLLANGPTYTGGSSPSYTGGSATIQNPIGQGTTISGFIDKLLTAVIQIGIPIAVLFIILAGFKFIVAQGKPAELEAARRNFLHVVIGVAIFLGASALAKLIVGTLKQIGVTGI